MNIGTLTGAIELEDLMTSVLTKLDTALTDFGKKSDTTMKGVAKSMDAIVPSTEKLAKVGKSLSVAVTAPIVALGGAAFAASMEVTGAMQSITKSTGATGDDLAGLQDSFKKVFVQVGESAPVVASVLGDVYKRTRDIGLAAPEVEKLTKQMIDFANVNQVEVAGAAKTVTTLMKALDIPMTEMGFTMDKLTYASQQSGMSVTELARGAISGGIAFKEMGFGLDESIALFAQFSKVGANVTDVTSTVSKVMAELSRSGVKDLKTGFTDLLDRIKNAATFTDALAISVDNFGARSGPKLVEEIRGGTFAVDAFVKAMQSAGGIVDKTAEATEPFTEKLTKLRHELSLALEPIGRQLVDAFNQLMPSLTQAARLVADLVVAFGKLPQPVQTATFVILGLAAAVGPVVLAISGTMKGLAPVIGFLVGPTKALAAETAVLTTAATQNTTAVATWGGALGRVGTSIADYVKGLKVIPAVIKEVGLTTAVTQTITYAWSSFLGSSLVTTIVSVGTAIVTFFLSPLGLIILAVTAVVGALRILTGSWEFLLTPLRAVWQAMQDVWQIMKYVGGLLLEEIKPAVNDVNTAFSLLSVVIGQVFTAAIKTARTELNALWELLKQSDEFNRLMAGFKLLHLIAESTKPLASGPGASSSAPSKLPGATGVEAVVEFGNASDRAAKSARELADATQELQTEAMMPLTAGFQNYIIAADKAGRTNKEIGDKLRSMAGGADITDGRIKIFLETMKKGAKEAGEFAKKIADLGSEWKKVMAGQTDTSAFEKAFAKLDLKKVMASPELQMELSPQIDKMIEDHKKLSKGMQDVRTASIETRLEFAEQDKKVLESSNLTLTRIDALKRMGFTEQDIAHDILVSTDALRLHITALQEAAQREANIQAFRAAGAKEQEDATARREALELSANQIIGQSYEDLAEMTTKTTMTATEVQIQEIKKAQTAREVAFAKQNAGLANAEQRSRDYHEVQEQLSAESIRVLMLDQNALTANSIKTHREKADSARVTYEEMANHPELYSQRAIAAMKKIAEEAERQADRTRTVWNDVWDNLKGVLESLPDMLASAFTGGGGLLGAMKAFGTKLSQAIIKPLMDDFQLFATKAQKIGMTISTSASTLIGGAVGGGTGASVGGMASAMTGLAAKAGLFGAKIGASALASGALSMGIGAAAVGAFMLIKHFTSISKEVKQAREEAAKFGEKLSAGLTEAQKLEAGGEKWKETVIAVRDAYLLLGKSASQAENVVNQLWDTSNPARSKAAQKEIEINMALAKNITAVRTLVSEYAFAGKAIPAALQANIDKLVRMGKLTEENAAAMLEMADTAVPSYADVTAAAERYGIVVETLGNAVQGLKITETANQVIADWELMELAGADMNVVMEGMRDEMLKLITDAATFGTALPAAMKPIIERMDKAGYFTDEFGNKLVDVSQLTFAETLEEKITRIVDAMILLADVIANQVGGALDNIGNKTYEPRIKPRYEGEEAPETKPPVYAARGTVVPFTPRGTDTVPAMLTPGETVLPVGAKPTKGGTVVIEISGRKMAEIVVPEMPDVLTRYRLGR